MRKSLLAFIFLLLIPRVLPAQISGAGQLSCSGSTTTGTAATSGTSNNTVLTTVTNTPAYAVLVQLDQTTTISGGAITFQVSGDAAGNYISVPVAQVINPSTGAQLTNPYTLVASTNQPFLIILNGYSNFQIKLTTAITGSATVTPYSTVLCQPFGYSFLDASGNLKVNINANSFGTFTVSGTVAATQSGNWTARIVGNGGSTVDGAPGSAAPTNVIAEGLYDGTNSRRALSDTTGRQFYLGYPDTTTTSYSTSKSFAGSSTTDNAVLPGNATNTVLVRKVIVSCTQTTAGTVNLTIVKRSTADSGGTSAAFTLGPDDSNYAAGVSAPLSYTGTGPSVGTPVMTIDSYQLGCIATTTASANDIYVLNRETKPIVLRGTAQQLAVNFGGAITGGNLTVTFFWDETTTP